MIHQSRGVPSFTGLLAASVLLASSISGGCSSDGSKSDGAAGEGASSGSGGASGGGSGLGGDGTGGDGAASAVESPFVTAGQRLLPQGERAGGQFNPVSVYDQQLGSTCGFTLTDEEAGTYHCLNPVFGELLFSDASCSEELANPRAGGLCPRSVESGTLLSLYLSQDGKNTQVLRQAGETKAAPETLYWRQPGSSDCVEYPSSVDELYSVEAADLSGYVTATIEPSETADAAVKLRQFVGSDGSRSLAYPALALADGTPCTPSITYDAGSLHCLPDVPGEDIEYETLEGCSRADTLQYEGMLREAESFPELQLIGVGDGAVQLGVFATPDGEALAPAGQWLDVDAGEACTREVFPDGSHRCLSGGFLDPLNYSDASCMQAVHSKFVGGCNPPADAPVIQIERAGPVIECRQSISSAVRMKQYDGQLYALQEESCMEATAEGGRGYYVEDEVLSAEDFPELEVISY